MELPNLSDGSTSSTSDNASGTVGPSSIKGENAVIFAGEKKSCKFSPQFHPCLILDHESQRSASQGPGASQCRDSVGV